jgi:2-polyprenyl-3-methyl-5-hydroxy-6-metoxy-1,4-benzoquinol methylase
VTLVLPGRSREGELMDQAGLSFIEFRACLRQLEWINRLSLGYRPTLRWLDRVARGRSSLSVLDVGSGHGDTLRRIAAWGSRRGVALRLTGLDLNPWSAEAAALATPPDMPITYETGDVFALDPARRFDVVVSALFTHHLDDAQLLRFLRWMQATARLGWFVNDLHRHRLPEWFLRAVFAAPGVNRLVRHDGPASFRRAMTRAEWQQALDAAGVGGRIAWHAPFRWGVEGGASHG